MIQIQGLRKSFKVRGDVIRAVDGVSMHGCAPDLVAGFIRNAGAAGLDLDCLGRLPAPAFFAPPAGGGKAR